MIYKFNNIELDTNNYRLLVDRKEVSVEPQVFNLIVFLIESKDRIISRDEMLEHIWDGRVVSDTSVTNHIKSARKVLGDDGVKQQVIKTIHSRGYQFIAQLKIEKSDFATSQLQPAKNFKYFYRLIVILIGIGILVLIYQKQGRLNEADSQNGILKSIAVLPLTNLNPSKQIDFLGFALTDQIIGKLIYNKNIRVKPSALVRKFDQEIVDPIAIGSSLKVQYVLSGNYLKQDDVIRMNFELLDVESKKLIWREMLEQKYENIFQLQDTIANLIAQKLDLGLSAAEYRSNKSRQLIDAVAYDYYLHSIVYPNSKEEIEIAIDLLKKALDIEPDYEPIHLQLAKRFRIQDILRFVGEDGTKKSIKHLLRALELNPRYFDALKYLSNIYYDTGEFLKAYKLAKKMLIINPNYSDAYFTLGKIYRKSGLVDKSIKMFKKSLSLEFKTSTNNQIGAGYFSNSQYKEARAYYNPQTQNAPSLAWQGSIALRLGDNKKALGFFQKNVVLYPDNYWGYDAVIFVAIIKGNKEKGLKELHLQEKRMQGVSEPTYFMASQYAAFGDKKNALRLFETSVKEGYFNLSMMRSDPFFDFLREDVKYIQIFNLAKQKHLTFKQAVKDDL